MVKITFSPGLYTRLLSRRMSVASPPISQAELGREMGASATQVTRWFTKNPGRRREPTLRTVDRIEVALARLERRRARKAAK